MFYPNFPLYALPCLLIPPISTYQSASNAAGPAPMRATDLIGATSSAQFSDTYIEVPRINVDGIDLLSSESGAPVVTLDFVLLSNEVE